MNMALIRLQNLRKLALSITALLATAAVYAQPQPGNYNVTVLNTGGPSQCKAFGNAVGLQVGEGNFTNANPVYAAMWLDGPPSTNINAFGCIYSYALGVSGDATIGYDIACWGNPFNFDIAFKVTHLNGVTTATQLLSAFDSTQAHGVYKDTTGTTFVGLGSSSHIPPTLDRALYWPTNSTVATDITPQGWRANAYGCWGNGSPGRQVGSASPPLASYPHAVLWSGTAASIEDLMPAGYLSSDGYGVYIDPQKDIYVVGKGIEDNDPTSNEHALLWINDASNFIDLTPTGYTGCVARGVVGVTPAGGPMEVGSGSLPNLGPGPHALAWSGSASSVVDLHRFLPASVLGNVANPTSHAYGIASNGEISGYVQSNAGTFAILWTPAYKVSGHVTLGDWAVSPAGVTVNIEVRTPNTLTVLESHAVVLDANGNYSFNTALPAGTYDVAAKASHWLRQTLQDVEFGFSGASGVDFSLINGDCNNSNAVTLADFARLRAAYGSTPEDANWDTESDLNGDLVVDDLDYNILVAHFGLSGDA
jgi:hypothetical protein